MLLTVLLNLLFLTPSTFSAQILGIVPTPSYSHQVVFHPLWKELSLKGHQVTVLTTNPMKDPTLTNLTEIDLRFSYETWHTRMSMNEMAKLSIMEQINSGMKLAYDLIDQQLQYPPVQELIHNNSKTFDVILLKPIFPAVAAFAQRFSCPLIQIFSLDGMSNYYRLMGNPSHPILNPDIFSTYSENPNFFERLRYVLGYMLISMYIFPRALESQQPLVEKYFGQNYPALEDILSRTSMMFVNTDLIFHPIRPLLPNVIQIGGGIHFTTPKPFPEKFQKVLDDATNGFIYFSLGSNIKSKLLPEQTRKVIMETFAELPYIVLWKFEEDLPGKTDNLIISKWFPQQDIFRHPNIKLFITQGGLQSREEAIYHHIPMIGMPFMGDQQNNVRRMVNMGMGLMLDYNTLDKQTFKETILEVIHNSKYRNRVKELAELVKDQPMTGLERAVWWTEYVIRHKGAKHLRSPALDLPTYQYFLLDVIGFCVIVVLVIGYVLFRLAKCILNLRRYFKPKEKLKVQ